MSNTSEAGESNPGQLGSVVNALRILRLLSARPSLRVADAASELGIARSTAHRLLATLKDHEFAAQDKANAAYRIGPALTTIGLAANRRLDIRVAAAPMLERLRDQTGETVSLSVLEGQSVRFVSCLEGTRSVRVADRTGLVLPASSTAGGKAILAALPEGDLALRFPDDELPALTASSPLSRERLRTELDAVRRDRYAINFEESESGISAVAAAVRDPTGSPLGALAVVVPASRFDLDRAKRWRPMLFDAVDAVEETLTKTA
ncbi:IclR family transcriptional regulator [Streptomyces sp. NPDC050560]|uniref:IclR family transcriptional regulator n=1 Tax=Streptomyces sp. NPDC050560 TaxID=3365630 RepID=UPI0037A6BFB7